MNTIYIIITIVLVALFVWQLARWARGNYPMWALILQGLASLGVIPLIIWIKNLPMPTVSVPGTAAAKKAAAASGNWFSDAWQALSVDWWPWSGIVGALVALAILWRIGCCVFGTLTWRRLIGEILIGFAAVAILAWLTRIILKDVRVNLPSGDEFSTWLSQNWWPWPAIIGGVILLALLWRLLGTRRLGGLILFALGAAILVGAISMIASVLPSGGSVSRSRTTFPEPGKETMAMPPIDANNVNWVSVWSDDWSKVVIRTEPGKPVRVNVPGYGYFDEYRERKTEVMIPSQYMRGERQFQSLEAPLVQVQFLTAERPKGTGLRLRWQ